MAEHTVQIVRPDVVRNRRREANRLTAVFLVVKGVVTVGAIVPLVDNVVSAVVIAAVVAVLGGLLARWMARRVRWWLEDRADARTAEQWRAAHPESAPVLGARAERAGVGR